MLKTNAVRLDKQFRRHRIYVRLKAGIYLVFHNVRTAVLFVGYIVLLTVAFLCRYKLLSILIPDSVMAAFLRDIYELVFDFFAVVSVPFVLILIGMPFGANRISDKLHRAGVVNAIDEPPILLKRYADKNNKNVAVYDFLTVGIDRAALEELQPEIESALDCFVVKITDGPSRNRVLLYAVPSGSTIPETILWDNPVAEDSVLVFGQTIAGTDVAFDIQKIPHILLGGSTGSGKTVLLRLLLKQCIAKGYKVFLADYKGGVDYPGEWHQSCTIITDTTELIPCLTDIVSELYRRKDLFLACGAANISEYNRNSSETLTHIIFAVDELAELVDKTGASKDQKAQIDEVISMMSTIARLGRAFGINLILSTQRPDANILPGQIKNNLDIRICGRADNVLSQIILDNTSAADRIPKESHYFLTQDGTLFQPYMWTD